MVIADRSSDPGTPGAAGNQTDHDHADRRHSEVDDHHQDHPALTTQPTDGEMEIVGRLRQASNQTFLVRITRPGSELRGVYKPIKGERPLWDFPEGTLGFREVAAYRVSRLAGFDVVPVTVLADGPFGPGSLQIWVDSEADEVDRLVDLVSVDDVPESGWFPIVEGYAADDSPIVVMHADDNRLRNLAVFDALINNADRKGGHILASRGRVFGVDHGICFHTENKLRTLLWGWSGDRLTAEELGRIRTVADQAVDLLADLLSEEEIEALMLRAEGLMISGRLPHPHNDWHTIPWPPF
ncbi:SCO1664 family protein [Microlunatus sp. Gsoil 973]|uniref:SCO1664 family protein n=1 Tax=Microlunatus sp. Gsoil 973 TaxID=2672569 RepID=UPI0012B48681|nr:SCO1664 family protein [Microlunatus sp. Gsoil 973]QGN33192.1 SCO1664 family protein [Microlunatus sp. Gsoil 973]